MTPCCQIGAWPDRERVDADILEGTLSIRKIAAKYSVDKNAIEKHRKCLGVKGGMVNDAHVRWSPENDPEDDPLPGEVYETNAQVEPEDVDGESVEETLDGIGGDARTPVFADPARCRTRADKVAYIIDLRLCGRWNGRPTAKRLARIWRYAALDEVNRMYGEATTALRLADGSDLEARKLDAMARLQADARRARKDREHKAAVQAEVELAKIGGYYPVTGPAAAVTVVVERARGEIGPLLERLCRRFVAAGMLDALTIVQEEAAAIAASEGAPLLVQAVDPARDG